MKKIVFILACIVSAVSFAYDCKRCNDKGYFEEYWICPLCRGYFYISPAWFDMDVGNTRWTVKTYWTGVQTKSKERKKLFSFKKCPLCENSTKKGGLKFVYICSCDNKVKMKPQVELAKKELFKLCKKIGLKGIGSTKDFEINDWRAINAYLHLKKSSARGEVLRKLVWEYTSEDFFDIEAADYMRDESKYQKLIFSQTDDEIKHKRGDYVTNIESNTKEEKNDKID